MPPSWPRKPNREDPAYRKLDDRMNFAVHLAILAASNSGLWFFHIFIRTNKQWLYWFTSSWLVLLLIHFLYVVLIADYTEANSENDII
ncbi:hypothetical protein RINTHH_5850 [Richelia intracellularis HH01]|uniref:2TM domain-containing protein n=1 Tax=Richelia intracellularis HH01 TaxID=1165094 RepID=M1X2F6_9NOST|nr:2TM domain-containing protein [Richelia intracellularis]CCH66740.1 hypothetical protein RINTHH_5850 [Richelia intracellularis HH01]